MFFILALSTDGGKTWVDQFDKKYDDGSTAAKKAREKNADSKISRWFKDHRYRVRQVVDTDPDNFMAREAAKNLKYYDFSRFDISTYNNPYYRLAHEHPEEKGYVRFFRTTENAAAERYTKIKLTRYLTNYLDLAIEDCEDFLVEIGYYTDSAVFEILRDADAIVSAYENGPTSCMNDPDEYPLPYTHPASVYASPDLGIAVIKRGEEVTARCVIFPDRKIHAGGYGHTALLYAELKKLGFRQTNAQSPWKGARLVRIFDEEEDLHICPYLDMSRSVSLTRDGKYLTMRGEEGKWGSRCCNGYTDHDFYN